MVTTTKSSRKSAAPLNGDSHGGNDSMPKQQMRDRIDSLFADIERLGADPDAASPRVRRELDALAARLAELEKHVTGSDGKTRFPVESEANTRASAPIIYEKERIGFAFTGRKLQKIRGESQIVDAPEQAIVVPLTSSNETIGEMHVQPSPEQKWSTEEARLIEAIAQQASQQIQSLRLLSATEHARSDAEAATRRFAHESWSSFLDAIHQNERIGFAYNQNSVETFTDSAPKNFDFQETIGVMQEQVGRLFLKTNPNRPLSEADKALVAVVAQQVGQQVENLRLLADASRARAEAEDATRRLTKQSWDSYTEKRESDSLGFLYDTIKVAPLNGTAPKDITLAQPLTVRGEPIGQLAVAGWKNITPEAADLVAAIAAQTSIHLETLRLNEELQKRAAELQELDRLKSSFLANMSHELRTPLNSILGFADVILEELDGPLTENMTTDLKLIQKNGQHLLHLINDVLDMAKIEAGRMNLNPEPFRIHEILEEVLSITSTLASEKNLALFIDKESDENAQVTADRTRIRQVMINLVNNAMKFTEQGKISIHASQEGDNVFIRVRDTGVGIPPDKLEAVFQEFTQVDTSTTRKAGGTGLGLPISRRLVEMHGGRLWAESTGVPGEGSTFIVQLPLQAVVIDPVEIEKVQK